VVQIAEPAGPNDAEIFVLLRRALNNRSLVAVTVEGEPQSYNSAILEVVREGRYLVLDELNPKTGHAVMATGRNVELRVLVDGIELRFHSHVAQVGNNDGLPYYKIAFPDSFHFDQKRDQRRIRVPLNQRYEVQLLFEDDREVTGELRDLSMGGLSARVHSGRLDPEADKNALVMCRLAISKEHSIVADVEIRYVSAAQHPRVPRFGARFVGLSSTVSNRIEKLCDELESKNRRGAA
jgi:c-di-GMP-binding flagellar brake protein YcgR